MAGAVAQGPAPPEGRAFSQTEANDVGVMRIVRGPKATGIRVVCGRRSEERAVSITRRSGVAIAGVLAVVLLALPVAAQSTSGNGQAQVTASDIQRVQDQVYETGNDVSRLRSRDSAPADDLQNQLDDLRDEVAYLKVKLRKEGSVNPDDL